MYLEKNKSGFTLVEIAIVLVIIGLFASGVLVAQSMISTAQIQKAVRTLSQYDIAFQNFKSKYNQIPGDSTIFTISGDNNGQYSALETANYWSHLSQGVSVKNSQGANYASVPDYLAEPATSDNCAQLDIDQRKSSNLCVFVQTLGSYDTTEPRAPWMMYAAGQSARFLDSTAGALLAKTQQSIDVKLDDGVAMTGRILADCEPGCCDFGGNYYIPGTGYLCELMMKFGTATGTY